MALKRELGLVSAVLNGLGVILGAGIYSLIAIGAGLAGDMLWLPFLLSALIAVCTALSYAELSSIFPKEAAEYNYTRKAFRMESLSFCVGWVLAIGSVIAAATVALAFGGYFFSLTGVPPAAGALCLICLMSLLNYWGIKESAAFNSFSTLLEVLGLVIVIVIAFMGPQQAGVDLLRMPDAGWAGIMAAVSVVFFAYIGFENIVNLSEEVKDSRRVIPLALVISLGVSTLLYMLVAVAAIHAVGWQALSQSDAPLTLVVAAALGPYSQALSYIALFATANTVLMFLIVSSRILYGMSEGGSLPALFSRTGQRGTPYYPVIIGGILACILALSFDLKTVAQLADLAVFIAYIFVNFALVALAGKKLARGFTSPRFFGVPVLAWLGGLSAIFLMTSIPYLLWGLEALVILCGLALYALGKAASSRKAARA